VEIDEAGLVWEIGLREEIVLLEIGVEIVPAWGTSHGLAEPPF